ncbi:MAG: hypothetical protein ACYTGW_02400 [Planctomycetota bacterium]|jgi:hypothetical protein
MTRPHSPLLAFALAYPLFPALLPAPLPSQEVQEKPRFEVCVLGALHAPWQFRTARFTPGHIRAALRKINADVVGVESNPKWFAAGKFHVVTYEAQGIAVPFARQHGLPVYGIDWMDHDAWATLSAERRPQLVSMLTTAAGYGSLTKAMFGQQKPEQLKQLTDYFFQKDFDFAYMNMIGSDEYAKKSLRGDPESKEFGGRRNRNIAARCEEVMKKHPGKRLVVVIGAGHKAVLDVLFGRMEGVRVLRLDHEIPAPTEKEVEAAWTDDDLAVALGHNLDGERSCFHRELMDVPYVRRLLARFMKAKGREAHAHYFAVRLALITNDLDAAEQSLSAIDKLEKEEEEATNAKLYPFPMEHWRMVYTFPQALCIARAELALARGQRGKAEKLLAGLAKAVRVPALPPKLQVAPEVVKALPLRTGWSTNSRAMEITGTEGPLEATLKKKLHSGLSALVHQVKDLPSDGPLRVAVHVDGSRPSGGFLEVYERTAEGMHTLGRKLFVVGVDRSIATADFKIRHTDRPLFVFVYLDGDAGTKYRLHRAEIQKVSEAEIPASWYPRFLAREYPRTLLAR